MKNQQSAIEWIASEYTARFPSVLKTRRTVGREAEYPIVTASGHAADVRQLWEPLMAQGNLTPKYDVGSKELIVGLEGPDDNYALEVGLGTIELNTRPCTNLIELQNIHEQAVDRLINAASLLGWSVLGYGIQPLSQPSLSLMAPKQRYRALHSAMGADWLWYTVTASDQLQIGISRPELVKMLNFGNLLTSILIAFCANSPIYGGESSPYGSAREGKMVQINVKEDRHGMPSRPFTDMVDYVKRLAQSSYLVERAEDGTLTPYQRPFAHYLQSHELDLDAFLLHEHYIWNSGRVRSTYGTLEVRPACQQPWPEHMAAAALTLGLVESVDSIMAYIAKTLGYGYWQVMRTYHQRVIQQGLGAPQPARNFLYQIVQLAEEGLQRRRFGEERLLEPIYKRLQRRQNPAQEVALIFQKGSIEDLLAHSKIRL